MAAALKLHRSIPAWAGNPPGRGVPCPVGQVYPRVGGEPSGQWRLRSSYTGLSPRGRGTLRGAAFRVLWARSIPAWAGNPVIPPGEAAQERVYPRVGGEPHCTRPFRPWEIGLSPRGRGTQTVLYVPTFGHGSIPAWAGNPPPRCCPGGYQGVYPRVGGEPKCREHPGVAGEGLSPRGRGTPPP